MHALVLERQGELTLRDIDLPLVVGPGDVKIAIDTVGVCGSDVHYYTHGRIGAYAVEAPMVLGHEAAGTVVAVGADVTSLAVGDRVCMEPGVPDLASRASKLGLYNVDPSVRFWATPPVHGVMAPFAVHPSCPTTSHSPRARWSSPSRSACKPPHAQGLFLAMSALSWGPARSAS